MNVAWLVTFAAEKEKTKATDAKNFWHAAEYEWCGIGGDKNFGARGPR